MNSENKNNKGEREVKKLPPASPRVVTYKKSVPLKKTQVPEVKVGKVKKNEIKVKVGTVSPASDVSDHAKKPLQTPTALGGENKLQNEEKAAQAPKKEEPVQKKKAFANAGKKPVNKAFTRAKKKRLKQGAAPIKVIIAVLAAVVLVVAGIIFAVYSAGYRYDTVKFSDVVTAEKYTIVFVGKLDPNGVPISGKLTYKDGLKATVGRTENNIVRVEYSNGWVYEGDFTALHRNGYGTLTMSGGDVYSGNFFYDRMWGNGVYTYGNGDKYTGEFENNKKCGDGVYQFANGNKYVGKFENDLRNGEGVFNYASGDVYEGAFVNDIKNDDNAKMIINTDSGVDVYVGSFVNDRKDGYGTYTFANGDTYEGELRMDYISGHGKYTWVSGRTYEGEFLNGAIIKDNSLYPIN